MFSQVERYSSGQYGTASTNELVNGYESSQDPDKTAHKDFVQICAMRLQSK